MSCCSWCPSSGGSFYFIFLKNFVCGFGGYYNGQIAGRGRKKEKKMGALFFQKGRGKFEGYLIRTS
jgi:hypothetical protein